MMMYKMQNSPKNHAYIFYAGEKEGPHMIRDLQKMFNVLKQKNCCDVERVIFPLGQHNEKYWRDEFDDFLQVADAINIMKEQEQLKQIISGDFKTLARTISQIENNNADALLKLLPSSNKKIIGITGPPGAGKSTLVDCVIAIYIKQQKKSGCVVY